MGLGVVGVECRGGWGGSVYLPSVFCFHKV